MNTLEENPNIVWENKMSKNGKEYEIGYHKDAEKLDASLAKTAFDIKVNWPATDSDEWIVQHDTFITTTGISRYRLEQNIILSIYKKRLEFTCQVHYDYYFTDETGDIYECNVYRSGNHYVRYNSSQPNITHIKGS